MKTKRFLKIPAFIFLWLFVLTPGADAQVEVPAVLSNIFAERSGEYYLLTSSGMKLKQIEYDFYYGLSAMLGNPSGTNRGIILDFKDKNLNGRIYFGLIHYYDSRYPHPVYRSPSAPIRSGKSFLNFALLRGKYDMTGWEESGSGTIGYRVIDNYGMIIYDGKISFQGTGPFRVVNTVISGPFINLVTPEGATISFETTEESVCSIKVDGKIFSDNQPGRNHEIPITGLQPGRKYNYTLTYGDLTQSYTFRTAPIPGTRKKFLFAYSSDSRGGSGWGERNIYGANSYIIKKIMAVCSFYNVSFTQFTGDLITGYKTSKEALLLEYHNWKNTVEPFAHHFPVIAGMGNHELLNFTFQDSIPMATLNIDMFPYRSESAEALFSAMVVNPHNGPGSEDGSKYDPDPEKIDFPSYDENVFYYIYDNMAMICLNSNYWYTSDHRSISFVGGNNHGYVMDNQLQWMEKVLLELENREEIDHIFITIHTPFFPNGGHVHDDMWYNGNNSPRPWIAGKPVEKGIIERRDQILDLAINRSRKVVALLTGDEHNYCKTEIGPDTQIYPENYEGDRLQISRTVYQINNGAAGAPYYSQEVTPWTPYTSGFTTQNAVCLFTVEGNSVEMKVLNPDTLEEVDRITLR